MRFYNFYALQSSVKMKILAIEFAPLCVSLTRRLQTLAAASWFAQFAFGPLLYSLVTLHILITISWLRLPLVLYLAWTFYDHFISRTQEKNGRPCNRLRHLKWWSHLRDYFPVTLQVSHKCHLDPRRNYLFCSFPHGIMCTGAFASFATEACGVSNKFPQHEVSVATLDLALQAPFHRELVTALGGISASARSLCYSLSLRGEKRRIVVLMPGGGAEASLSRPGHYRVYLKRRKGFVGVALKTGTPLVPVMSFGESEVFDQIEWPVVVRPLRDFVRRWSGASPVLMVGRGFFQYSFGLIPRRHAITTFVGEPIEVQQNPDPSPEDVDLIHAKFVKGLVDLFEENKEFYLKNHSGVTLEIV